MGKKDLFGREGLWWVSVWVHEKVEELRWAHGDYSRRMYLFQG